MVNILMYLTLLYFIKRQAKEFYFVALLLSAYEGEKL